MGLSILGRWSHRYVLVRNCGDYTVSMRLRSVLAFTLLAAWASAQTASDLASESHHHLILQNSAVRVYSLVLPPREQSYVRHEHNFLLVSLQDCELVMWREGASDITSFQLHRGAAGFAFGGKAQGLRNQMNATFRGIVVEFLGAGVTTYGYQLSGQWDFGYSGPGAPVDPHGKFFSSLQMGTATAIDAQLLPGDLLPAADKAGPELLIPVSDVDLKAGAGSKIGRTAGDALWIEAERAGAYTNAGSQVARFVVIRFGAGDKAHGK